MFINIRKLKFTTINVSIVFLLGLFFINKPLPVIAQEVCTPPCIQGDVCVNGTCITEDEAQQQWLRSYFEQTPDETGQALDATRETGQPSLEAQTAATVNLIFNIGTCAGSGYGCGENAPLDTKGGAVGVLNNSILAMVANPPASSLTYLADLGKNMGIATPAYAQGIGFAGLNPILNVWKAFRNLSYLVFILIFVIYGFMIMFRVKIDPRTVVSFASALPKIVVALILVTFSYAIVGLIIDLSYVLIFLSLSFFQLAGLINNPKAIQDIVFNKNIFVVMFSNFGNLVGAPAGAFGEIVAHIVGDSGIVQTAVGKMAGGLAALVISIALVFVMFKLYFTLVISYVNIILEVIFAPIKLLFDVLPGQNGFANWIKGIVSNILVFPATVFMFTLAAILVGSQSNASNPWAVTTPGYGGNSTGWIPPLIGMQSSSGASLLPSIIALGMILLTPKVVDMIKEAFGQKGGSPYASALGEGIGTGVNVLQGGIGRIRQRVDMDKQRALLAGQIAQQVNNP